jgi:hypothetical protein
MSARESALEAIATAGHAIQLYEADGRQLVRNVGDYLHQGLLRGDGLLAIASRRHRELFLQRLDDLGADPRAAIASGQLTMLDAAETLSHFMSGGKLDWERFEREIAGIALKIRERNRGGLRAYGEMVGLLWEAGMYSAAIQLEKFWNRLLGERQFSLYCGYPIDIFGGEFQLGAIEALLRAHTHMLPGGAGCGLDDALHMAMDEVLGKRADGVRSLMNGHVELSGAGMMPAAESSILWLRANLPEEADEVLARARRFYQESQRLGEPAAASNGVRQ